MPASNSHPIWISSWGPSNTPQVTKGSDCVRPDHVVVVVADAHAVVALDASGAERLRAELGNSDEPMFCAYDGQSVTATPLWTLPSSGAGTTGLRITAVWRGVVYGDTEHGPVGLDAGTGQELEPAPGVAPYLLNERIGIAVTGRGGLAAYRAVR